jgi:hypothetical protein
MCVLWTLCILYSRFHFKKVWTTLFSWFEGENGSLYEGMVQVTNDLEVVLPWPVENFGYLLGPQMKMYGYSGRLHVV